MLNGAGESAETEPCDDEADSAELSFHTGSQRGSDPTGGCGDYTTYHISFFPQSDYVDIGASQYAALTSRRIENREKQVHLFIFEKLACFFKLPLDSKGWL